MISTNLLIRVRSGPSRARWAGNAIRMEEKKIPKRVLENKYGGRRRVGRPRLLWEDRLWKDIKKLGMMNCE